MTLWRRFLNLFLPAPPECDRCGEPFAPWKRTIPTGCPPIGWPRGMPFRGTREIKERNRCNECCETTALEMAFRDAYTGLHPGQTLILGPPRYSFAKPVMPPNRDVR